MKLEKNRIHLFILLFAVSSLLVHVPSNAYAAADTWTDATTTNVSGTTMRGVSMIDANNGVAVGHSGQIVFAASVSSEDSTTGEEKESSSDECYDCEAPKLTKVEVHVSSSPFDYVWHFDQKSPYPMFDDDITPIVADPGDEVEIILELTDNRTLERIADSGTCLLYTSDAADE